MYLMDAARVYTCGAVDKGEQPAVISAIAKYNLTELSRKIINDGMDILGGAGICRGPRNLLANIYTATPISITVEGANILTRTLMIFGQGAIRCHPYVYAEIAALKDSDVFAFDRAFWNHIGLMVRNGFRAVLLSLSRGYFARAPVKGPTAVYYRKLEWASATFAFLTDIALFSFGGTLKRREKLTGRFADILSWMYLGTATLRRFEAEGCKSEDLPFVHWVLQYALAQIQQAFEGIFSNLPVPVLGRLLRGPVAWWWRLNSIGSLPSDQLGSQIARSLQTPGQQRDRLTADIYIPSALDETLGRLEAAFLLSSQAGPILKTIKAASRAGMPQQRPDHLIAAALEAGVISKEQAELIRQAECDRHDAVQVDAFTVEEYQQSRVSGIGIALQKLAQRQDLVG
jgi:acyl-CoA dehydrogenase